eukprot:Clim_evm16s134 gene=Clim_evmTU16s134
MYSKEKGSSGALSRMHKSLGRKLLGKKRNKELGGFRHDSVASLAPGRRLSAVPETFTLVVLEENEEDRMRLAKFCSHMAYQLIFIDGFLGFLEAFGVEGDVAVELLEEYLSLRDADPVAQKYLRKNKSPERKSVFDLRDSSTSSSSKSSTFSRRGSKKDGILRDSTTSRMSTNDTTDRESLRASTASTGGGHLSIVLPTLDLGIPDEFAAVVDAECVPGDVPDCPTTPTTATSASNGDLFQHTGAGSPRDSNVSRDTVPKGTILHSSRPSSLNRSTADSVLARGSAASTVTGLHGSQTFSTNGSISTAKGASFTVGGSFRDSARSTATSRGSQEKGGGSFHANGGYSRNPHLDHLWDMKGHANHRRSTMSSPSLDKETGEWKPVPYDAEVHGPLRSPDLIMLSLAVGTSMCKFILRLKKEGRIPGLAHCAVVISVPHDLKHFVRELSLAGADDYLLKPLRMDVVRGVWQNIWRKRKERELTAMLQDERARTEHITKELDAMKDEIDTVVDTPIQIIIRTISDLKQASGISEEVKETLNHIIDELKAQDLYKPVMSRTIHDEEMDPETRAWMMENLLDSDVETPSVDLAPRSSIAGGRISLELDVNQIAGMAGELLPVEEVEEGGGSVGTHSTGTPRSGHGLSASGLGTPGTGDGHAFGSGSKLRSMSVGRSGHSSYGASPVRAQSVQRQSSHVDLHKLEKLATEEYAQELHRLSHSDVHSTSTAGGGYGAHSHGLTAEEISASDVVAAAERLRRSGGHAETSPAYPGVNRADSGGVHSSFGPGSSLGESMAAVSLSSPPAGHGAELMADNAQQQQSATSTRTSVGGIVDPTTLLQDLQSWSFDVFSVPEADLTKYARAMFHAFDFMDVYDVDPRKLTNLVTRAQTAYQANPYHNFRHAVDVMQAIFLILVEHDANEYLTTLEVFALLTSALMHDAGHPGYTNNFLIQTSDTLAIRYNDRSPLENHHASTLFEFLEDPECAVWENLNPAEKREFRSVCINVILATDMAHHVDFMGQFQTLTTNFNPHNMKHRTLVLQLLMKLGDISNPLRPIYLAKYWSDHVVDELFAQGDREKQLGMKVSAFSDRNIPHIPLFSMNFIDFMVAPLYRVGALVFPKLNDRMDVLLETREYWKTLQEEEEAENRKQDDEAALYQLQEASSESESDKQQRSPKDMDDEEEIRGPKSQLEFPKDNSPRVDTVGSATAARVLTQH